MEKTSSCTPEGAGGLPSEMAAFLDPGLDFNTDDLSASEAENYLAWCARVHGENNLDLVPFAEFFVECDPMGLKQLRRHTAEIGLPLGPAVLMWAYTYCLMGSAKGTLYEVIAARELGIGRQEIVDLLKCAGYFGGPYALNAAGELTLPYLRAWDTDTLSTLDWPEFWSIDPEPFRSGIDHKSSQLTAEELGCIEGWYVRVHGEFPAELRLIARWQPAAFKMSRVRFERMAMLSLPVQLLPLLMLHSATVTQRGRSARIAAQLARAVGISPDLVMRTISWAAVLGGAEAMEVAVSAARDALEGA